MVPDKVQRLFNVETSETSIRNLTVNIGKLLFQQEQLKSEEADSTLPMIPKDFENIPEKTFVEIDGLMLNTTANKEETWKEYKLGMFFSDKDIKISGSGKNQRATITKKNFTGSMALGAKDLKKRLKYWLKQTKNYWSNLVILISDGAVWIENIFQEIFPGSPMILDWYHVTEKLWECAKELYGNNKERKENWVSFYETLIWNGEIKIALKMLLDKTVTAKNQTPIRELYQYFDLRKDRMKYKEFREKGYFLGSGAIESANKYVIQARLKRAGMKWEKSAGNAVAFLRNSYFSDRWDSIWLKKPPIMTPNF